MAGILDCLGDLAVTPGNTKRLDREDACYAIRTANVRASNPHPAIAAAYAGLVHRDAAGLLDWTGTVRYLPERLEAPLGRIVPTLGWVVASGESGPGAREAEEAWLLGQRDQAAAAAVPFWMKQAGAVLARRLGLRGAGDDYGELPPGYRVRQLSVPATSWP